MMKAIQLIVENLGVSFENVLLIVGLIGGMIFYAKDFKLGVVIQLIMAGGLFMWFYEAGYNYAPSLIVFFITLTLLALSIYSSSRQSAQAGLV